MCRPKCYWAQFREWEHSVLTFFRSIASYEVGGREHQKRAYFRVDWNAFSAALLAEDPIFRWPHWEPWEVRRLMHELAGYHNQNDHVQRDCIRRSGSDR